MGKTIEEIMRQTELSNNQIIRHQRGVARFHIAYWLKYHQPPSKYVDEACGTINRLYTAMCDNKLDLIFVDDSWVFVCSEAELGDHDTVISSFKVSEDAGRVLLRIRRFRQKGTGTASYGYKYWESTSDSRQISEDSFINKEPDLSPLIISPVMSRTESSLWALLALSLLHPIVRSNRWDRVTIDDYSKSNGARRAGPKGDGVGQKRDQRLLRSRLGALIEELVADVRKTEDLVSLADDYRIIDVSDYYYGKREHGEKQDAKKVEENLKQMKLASKLMLNCLNLDEDSTEVSKHPLGRAAVALPQRKVHLILVSEFYSIEQLIDHSFKLHPAVVNFQKARDRMLVQKRIRDGVHQLYWHSSNSSGPRSDAYECLERGWRHGLFNLLTFPLLEALSDGSVNYPGYNNLKQMSAHILREYGYMEPTSYLLVPPRSHRVSALQSGTSGATGRWASWTQRDRSSSASTSRLSTQTLRNDGSPVNRPPSSGSQAGNSLTQTTALSLTRQRQGNASRSSPSNSQSAGNDSTSKDGSQNRDGTAPPRMRGNAQPFFPPCK